MNEIDTEAMRRGRVAAALNVLASDPELGELDEVRRLQDMLDPVPCEPGCRGPRPHFREGDASWLQGGSLRHAN
jgi:hypothetical protein